MLPLVQMHQLVQPELDFFGPHPGHLRPDYSPHHQGSYLSQPSQSPQNTNSTPRSFGFRGAQNAPALHRITTSFSRLHAHPHDQAEHSLRRKTPSGTIDNGYDGSLTHVASGPPPLKHMIVPASSKIFPTAMVHRASNPSAGGVMPQTLASPWAYSAPAAGRNLELEVEAMGVLFGSRGGWGVGSPNAALDPGVGHGASFLQHVPQHNYHGGSGLQPLLGPGYQQPLSETVYSPGNYQQPAVWRDGSLGYQTFIPLANNYTPQNSVGNAFMAPQSTLHHGLSNVPGLGQAHNFGLPLPSHPLDDGFSRYGHSHLAHHATPHGRNSMGMAPGAGYLAKPVPPCEANSPARFRERALQSAHKSYNDLLLHLTTAKKAHHARSGSGSRPSSKLVVYPKPSTTPTGGKARPLSAFADPTASYAQQVAQKEAAVRAFASSQHQRSYHEIGSPVLRARASLEMLANLCEQSGWKWVEGMLLGGCLYYGLERYEEALEWFRRIVSLDPRWVVCCFVLFFFPDEPR